MIREALRNVGGSFFMQESFGLIESSLYLAPMKFKQKHTPTLGELTLQRRDAHLDSDWKRLMQIDDTIRNLYGIRYTPWGVR